MAEKAAKAEISLAKTCDKLGITTEGKRWLDLALDPFKDLNMPTSGFPDAVEIPSVVETIHDSFVVSVPSSVAPGGLWDCNIFIDQLYNTITMRETDIHSQGTIMAQSTQSGVIGSRGGIQVRSGPSNGELDQLTSTGSLSLKSDVLPESEVRVIGIGLEIHNTTAELQRQGAIVCYRSPNTSGENTVATLVYDFGVTACIPSSVPCLKLAEPPRTASQAIDMPGSLQWEAKDGAYIVPVLNEPTIEPETTEPMMVTGQNDSSGKVYAPTITSTGAAKLITMENRNFIMPFSLSGCFLSGLSPTTTLQVNLTYYVEVFPNKDNVLRRIAQPSPGTDANAMALYGKIIETLPVGCQVSDNFLGAFMAGVSRIAGAAVQYLPQLGNALRTGYNIASGAFNVAQSIQNGMDNRTTDSVQGLIGRGSQQGQGPSREIVPSRPPAPGNPQRSIVVYQPPHSRDVVVTNQSNGKSVVMNTGLKTARTRSAKKKHRAHINQAAAASVRDGNRWIEHKK